MNILEDVNFDLLDNISSSAAGQYAKSLREHISNVQKGYQYLKANLPELIEKSEIPEDELDKQLEMHDKSKWSDDEFPQYAEHYFGKYKDSELPDQEYDNAWVHHYKNNPHHPEYWEKEDMPMSCIIELICDWWSFSWKNGNLDEIFEYWENNKEEKKNEMSEKTFNEIEKCLELLKISLEKSIDLNEKAHWDTILTKPFDLNKDITLYHYSPKKLDKLIPLGINVGNKLSKKPRKSIWFTEHEDEWVLPIWAYLKSSYKEDYKNGQFTWGFDNFNYEKFKDGTYKHGIKITKEFYEKHKSEIDNFKTYRYTKTFKIKELGRGTEATVPEWTYDEDVIPDSVDVKTGRELISNRTIVFATKDEIEKVNEHIEELHKKYNSPFIFQYLTNYEPEWWKFSPEKYRAIRKDIEKKTNTPSFLELHKNEKI